MDSDVDVVRSMDSIAVQPLNASPGILPRRLIKLISTKEEQLAKVLELLNSFSANLVILGIITVVNLIQSSKVP